MAALGSLRVGIVAMCLDAITVDVARSIRLRDARELEPILLSLYYPLAFGWHIDRLINRASKTTISMMMTSFVTRVRGKG
jgi:hypothetical protein